MAIVNVGAKVPVVPKRRPVLARLVAFLRLPVTGLDTIGDHMRFYIKAYASIPLALRDYRREVLRLLAATAFGTGALALIGGTVVTVAFLTSFAGIEVGIQGYSQLSDIGVEALSGFISAYINTRLAAPIIAGIALVATVGAGFTAQLGAMRVSEEIDALEVMSIKSIPFLVSTRIIAGFLAIIPLYAVALLASYACTRLVVTVFYGQSSGAYGHYFTAFLIPSDILASFVKVLIMAVVIMSVHCYYGYNATGGPAGVGSAVGKAVRLSLILVLMTDMFLSFALYGATDTLNISGVTRVFSDVVRKRLAGLLGLAIVVGGVGTSIGAYSHAFVSSTDVTVVADRAGLLLDKGSKVKVKGLPIGEVRDIDPQDDGTVRLTLALDPDDARHVSRDAVAEIGASTVFGAKYVELTSVDGGDSGAIRTGDTLRADDVTTEVSSVLDTIDTVVSSVDPARLNQALTGLATALDGRGEKLGALFSDSGRYLAALNTRTDQLTEDIDRGADVLDLYADVSPDLLSTVDQFSTTSRTLYGQRSDLRSALTSVSSAAASGTDLLGSVIGPLQAAMSNLQPVLSTLDRYAPVLTCTIQGLGFYSSFFPRSMGGGAYPGVTGVATIIPAQSGYTYPKNLPKFVKAGAEPRCYGLPKGTKLPPHYYFDDGTAGIYQPGTGVSLGNPLKVYPNLVEEFFGTSGLGRLLGGSDTP